MNEIKELRREIAKERRKAQVIKLKEQLKFYKRQNSPTGRFLRGVKNDVKEGWESFLATLPKTQSR